MKRIAPHLYWLGGAFSNIWLIVNPQDQKRYLIDTGHAIERLPLMGALWKAGVRLPGDLTGVLLTHRHSDHAGNAAWVRKHYGARVVCHEEDAKILRGDKPAAPLKRGSSVFYKEWFSGMEDRRPAFTDVDETFEDASVTAGSLWKSGFRIYPALGHTEGSVIIYHEPTATLFTGDSILTHRSFLGGAIKLRLVDPDFCLEPQGARRSVLRFLAHLPTTDILCPGHGPVLDEAASLRLKKLFDSEDA